MNLDLEPLRADSFWQRWRGLRPLAHGRSMLFETSSVHGLGMREDMWAVGIDEAGSVIAIRRLRRGGVVWIGGARWILEMPIDAVPPGAGTSLADLVSPTTPRGRRRGRRVRRRWDRSPG